MKWSSTNVANLFPSNFPEGTPLVDMIAIFLDILEDEGGILSPVVFMRELSNIYNIYTDSFDELKSTLFADLVPDELIDIIDDSYTWSQFITISRQFFLTRGTEKNTLFIFNLIANVEFKKFLDNDYGDLNILEQLGFDTASYKTSDMWFNSNGINHIIPGVYALENISVKEGFTITQFKELVKAITPLGVLFLIYGQLIDIDNHVTFCMPFARKTVEAYTFYQLRPQTKDLHWSPNIYLKNDFRLEETLNIQIDSILNKEEFLEVTYMCDISYSDVNPVQPLLDYDDELDIDAEDPTQADVDPEADIDAEETGGV